MGAGYTGDMFQKSILLTLLALPLLAAGEPVETYDLRPLFSDGMQLVITNTLEANLELDEASARLGDLDILEGGVAASGEMLGQSRITETVEATREGSIAAVRRTIEESTVESSGDYEAMGESSGGSETEEGEFAGRTLVITVDEEGQVTVEDVSEGDFETLDDERLATQDQKTHFEELLPTEPVEVGDTWDPSEGFLAEAMEELRAGAEAEGDEEEFEQLMEVLTEYGSAEATGTLESVEDGVATISWEMEFTVDIPDLMDVIVDLADPEDTEGMPDSAEASMSMTLTVEGSGQFDLRAHQLTSFTLEGSMSMDAEGAVSQDGMDIEGDASASGAFTVTGGVEVVG